MSILLHLPAYLRQVAEDLLPIPGKTLPDEDAMGLLADENAIQHAKTRSTSRQGRRLWKSIGVVGLLISCGGLLFSNRNVSRKAAATHPSVLQENHYLHVVLPTRLSPEETCRTILSGAALNYPIPWAISWHADVDENLRDIGGDLAKLESILSFLEIQDPARNNDTVIVLANPRSWFQTRPEVLLKRYRSIQQEYQHQGLRQNATRELYELQNMKRKIVLSIEKKCLSKQGADCLPVQAEDNTPRFVSHNFAIGPVEDLRLLYRDAIKEAKGLEEHHSAFDEHSVFSRLFNNQQHVNSAPRDYSIALDLVDRLSFAATSDVSFAPSTGSGLRFWNHRSLPKLTEDILISEPPFHLVSSSNLPRKWSDLSFLIPKKAATVPAIVQLSAEFNSSLSQEWFERLWFHPHGRKLVESYAVTPKAPVASFTDPNGVEQRFYSPHAEKLGAKAANDEIHPWNEICEAEAFTGNLFVDGLGT